MESPLTKKAAPFNTKGPMLLKVVFVYPVLASLHTQFIRVGLLL